MTSSRAKALTICFPLAEMHELVTRAVETEIAFALFDERIAHSVAGSSLDAAMARPAPTFEGEPLARRRTHDMFDAVVVDAPGWTRGRGEPVLTLVEPRSSTTPSPAPAPP